ncbi:MAG: hypothetical protein ACRERC_19270 [Candidatus Binatia bacterium]
MLDHAPEAVLTVTPRARSRGFLVWLALITLVPLIGLPLALQMAQVHGMGFPPGSLALFAITGPMHVAATGFFYLDPAFRPVIGESRVSCLWSLGWLPLLILTVGLVGTVAIGSWAYLLIYSFHNIWLFYHYQRQNFGLASFVSTHVGFGRLPDRVNTALNVAAAGAIITLLGTPSFFLPTEGLLPGLPDTMPGAAYVVLRPLGTAIYAAALLLMLGVFRSEPRLRENAWLAGALVLGIGFFLPTIVFQSAAMGFLPIATAHGAQYILMMSVVSGRSARGVLGFVLMCTVGVVAGLGLDAMKAWPVILAATGLVQVHFLVDAKVWRLREKRQRAIMHDRFDFLLAP